MPSASPNGCDLLDVHQRALVLQFQCAGCDEEGPPADLDVDNLFVYDTAARKLTCKVQSTRERQQQAADLMFASMTRAVGGKIVDNEEAGALLQCGNDAFQPMDACAAEEILRTFAARVHDTPSWAAVGGFVMGYLHSRFGDDALNAVLLTYVERIP
jgi:hypothetical protein